MNRRIPFLLRLALVILPPLPFFACGAGDDGAGAPPAAETEAEPGAASAPHNVLTPQEAADGWILLFDGVSTDGWRGYGMDQFPEAGWAIEDGNLVVFASDGSEEGLGGDIVTEAMFEDFELVFDVQISPVGNSGVFYRVAEMEDKAMWEMAPEFQVLDDTAYIEMGTMDMETHLTGDNYDLHSSRVTASNPIGEWNTARIVVEGHQVEHWLNGELTVSYELYSDDWEARVAVSKFDPEIYARAPRGHIGIQDHGHEIRYRNIKIRPLNQESVALFNGRDLEGWTVHGTERWFVEEGDLVCESGPDAQYGYLASDDEYRDFELTLEFKQEADGNSGVFFRSHVDGTTISGWQAEVAPPGLWSGGIYESYGRGWLVQPPPEKDAALRMGEWNHMRIRAEGPTVTTWINGERMVHLTDEQIGDASGHIALQIHDGGGIRVRWRNIRVVEL
jgi:hypothetical protein